MSSFSAEPIRVLHVDDEPDFAEMTADFLEREDDQLTIETETSVDEAHSRLAEDRFDCIVSDYDMPGLNGIEFLETVREDYPDLPFILFTGKGSEEVASDAISAGVTDYLQKGIGTGQYTVLANRVTNAVERSWAEREADRVRRHLEAIVENTNDAIVTIDADSTVLFANPAVEDLLGYQPSDLDGESLTTLMPPRYHDEHREAVERHLETGERTIDWTGIEFYARHRDGHEVPVSISFGEFKQDGERRFVGIVRDLSGRKEREHSLEQYETIVDAVGDPMYALDADGHYTFVNDAFVEETGYSKEEILGEHVSLILTEDSVEKGRETIRELLADDDRTKATIELDRITSDGERIPSENTIALLPPDERGRFCGSAGVVRDISERKSRERELEHERDRFESLFETLPEPIALISGKEAIEATIDRVNAAFEEVFGYEEAQVVGKHLNDVVVPEGKIDEAQRIDQQSVDEDCCPIEVHRKTADGHLRDFLLMSTYFGEFGEDDLVEGFAIYADITERKQRERALTALHEVGLDLDASETIDEVCQRTIEASEEILEFDQSVIAIEEEGLLKVRAISEKVSQDLPTTMPVGEGIAGKTYRTGETFLIDDLTEHEEAEPQGAFRSLLSLPIGVHGNFQAIAEQPGTFDETDRELAELLIDRTESALDRLQREHQLQRQNDRREEFASVVSHDLRNPLNVAQGNLELAREECDSEHLDSVANALDRCQALIDDLLTLARGSEQAIDIESVDLAETVDRCWRTVETGEATLATETDSTIRADQSRIQQLLENLIRNAVEHGGEDVTVRVGDFDDGIGFYIEDDGPGIPEDDRDQVFESGYSTAKGGTGFGLAIVREIAIAHGWGVTVTDGENGGARFEITGVEFV